MNEQEKKYISIKQANNRSPRTIAEYKKQMKKLHDYFNKSITEIGFYEFTDYINTIENERTKNNVVIFLKNFYKVLELEQGDFKQLKPQAPKPDHTKLKRRLISKETLDTLINVTPNPRDKAILELLFFSGFRIGELISIKYGDVNIQDNKINVSCTMSKTYTRELPIFKEMPHLQNYILHFHETKQNDDYLFLSKWKGELKQFNPKSVNAMIKQSCKRAGLMHYKPHDFRHTRATLLCKEGIPDNIIKKYMGWSDNSQMLMFYNHNGLEEYENIIQGKNRIKTVQQYKEENETLQSRVERLEKRLDEVLNKQ